MVVSLASFQVVAEGSEDADTLSGSVHSRWSRAWVYRVALTTALGLAACALVMVSVPPSKAASNGVTNAVDGFLVRGRARRLSAVLDANGTKNMTSVDEKMSVDEILHEVEDQEWKNATETRITGSVCARPQHCGERCLYHCGGKAGHCNYCGYGNACCRRGGGHESSECGKVRDHQFGSYHYHTCVNPNCGHDDSSYDDRRRRSYDDSRRRSYDDRRRRSYDDSRRRSHDDRRRSYDSRRRSWSQGQSLAASGQLTEASQNATNNSAILDANP